MTDKEMQEKEFEEFTYKRIAVIIERIKHLILDKQEEQLKKKYIYVYLDDVMYIFRDFIAGENSSCLRKNHEISGREQMVNDIKYWLDICENELSSIELGRKEYKEKFGEFDQLIKRLNDLEFYRNLVIKSNKENKEED